MPWPTWRACAAEAPHDGSELMDVANELARQRQIPRLVEKALCDAGLAGIFPTPLDAVQDALGIEQVVDISQLPEPVEAKKPARWKRILGALLFEEKTIFVDFSQGEERSNFTEAHETAHQLIPWHQDAFILDHEGTLFKDVKDALEQWRTSARRRSSFRTAASILAPSSLNERS
jgi:hypothetical protein